VVEDSLTAWQSPPHRVTPTSLAVEEGG